MFLRDRTSSGSAETFSAAEEIQPRGQLTFVMGRAGYAFTLGDQNLLLWAYLDTVVTLSSSTFPSEELRRIGESMY